MTHLHCTSCDQRFHTAATRRFPPCVLCGGELRPVEVPPAGGGRVLAAEPPPIVRARPGSYPDGERSYPSLLEFGRARKRRISSAERDFGLRWSDDSRLYRAAWVAETGDVYIVQLGPAEDGGGHVEVLAEGAPLRQVERVLEGWRDAVSNERSLRWLRERVGRLTPANPLALAG